MLFLLLAGPGMGQVVISGLDQYIEYANINKTTQGSASKYTEMDGNPFLDEAFRKGRVKLRNGKLYEGPLRYDIYADEIEFQTGDGEIYEIQNPEAVEQVVIGTQKLLCFVKEEGRDLEGYYEELVNGNFTLLAKHRVDLKDAVPAKPYVDARPPTFVKRASRYFVVGPNGDIIPLSNKKDLQALGKNTADAQNFIKKNKLRCSKEADMVMFIRFLNEN